MTTETIINSITIALSGTFDRDAAVKRLQGAVNQAGTKKLVIRKGHGNYTFYVSDGSGEEYESKSSDELYTLARKRYCKLLITILETTAPSKRARKFRTLRTLLDKYEAGNLDLARIVLAKKQYSWYSGNYQQKSQKGCTHILGDIMVRSKSEQDIGLELIALAVPFHFEEQLKINVHGLVAKLDEKIRNGDFAPWEPKTHLFYMRNDTCFWNVPPQLEWMNALGSLWRTYNFRTGEVTIYPDFKIMLADGTVILWEHEGLVDEPLYRCNASERITIMECTRTIEHDNLITTYEFDTDDIQRITNIIATRILPRLWW